MEEEDDDDDDNDDDYDHNLYSFPLYNFYDLKLAHSGQNMLSSV